jgi:hypothetical protein
MQHPLGFIDFMENVDGVGMFLLVALLLMSVATWYLIVTKTIANFRMRRHSGAFLAAFWGAPDLDVVAQRLTDGKLRDPFSHLAHHGFRVIAQHASKNGRQLIEAGSQEEFLTRSLRRAIEQDTARLEAGLTVLASVGSSAPFVGLFGTVWGVSRAGRHRHQRAELARQGGGPGGRGAHHDRARARRGDTRGARLQLLHAQQPHGAVRVGRVRPRPVAFMSTGGRVWNPPTMAVSRRLQSGAHDGFRRILPGQVEPADG